MLVVTTDRNSSLGGRQIGYVTRQARRLVQN